MTLKNKQNKIKPKHHRGERQGGGKHIFSYCSVYSIPKTRDPNHANKRETE